MTRNLLSALLLLAAPAFAQGPSAEWRTMTTPHFRVHYPARSEAWAARAAADIESVRAAVVRETGFSPEEVTDVLIMNPIAAANGATLPLLDHPRIVLFTEPPEPESQIGEFRSWIDLLVVHEMTHLIHLLRPSRNPMERMAAHVLPLNPITLKAPRWVVEGYATVIEGRLTGSGRPASSIRAAILRKWAVSGRLLSYGQLDSDRRFLGMSMAYLAGSAFLEWLEQRGGPDSLRHLWARMTARRRRSFDEAFAGVFGESPAKLYGLFTAELSERAMAVARAEQPSLREGDPWQDTARGSGDPAVSPDGKQLALVLRNERGEAKLVVLPTGPNPDEEKFQKRVAEMLKRDPQDVAPVRTRPLPRKPLHTLTPPDGGDVTSPRWTRDGKSILYTHRQPDREGFLHHDLFLWTPSTCANRRVTRLADVEDADPLPDGRRAIAVRNRDGFSQLVTIELSTGAVTPFTKPSLERIVAHPRASADGRIAWTEHDGQSWRVRVGAAAPGRPAAGEAPAATLTLAAFQPEWRGETLVATVASGGFIEIARIDNGLHVLTRSAGAALEPAPAPDGSIYYMSLEPDGFVVRHLTRVGDELPSLTFGQRLVPAIAPAPAEPARFQRASLPPSRPYGIGRQEFTSVVGGAWTSYGASGEIGARLGDVAGRLDTLAIASSGSDSADRGVALVSTWRGWPVAVTGHLFNLRRRRGVEIRGEYQSHGPRHGFAIEAGGLGGRDSRAFADGVFAVRQRHGAGRVRVAIDSAHHSRASAAASALFAGIGVALEVEAGRRVSVGGVASSITPDAVLVERVLDPALPLAFEDVRRYRGLRAEATFGGVTAFWQRHDPGAGLRFDVRGLEMTRSSRAVPLVGLPAFDLTVGVARASGIRGTRGWLALRWRP